MRSWGWFWRMASEFTRTVPFMAIIWTVLVTGMLGRTSATTKMLTNDFEEMGLDFGNVYQVVSLMVGFTLAIDLMVLIMIGLTTGKAMDWVVVRICRGRSCLSRVSKLFLSLMQWLTYWLAWASVVFVIVTLIASTGLTVTFFISSIICSSGTSDAYIVNMVNNGYAQYANIFQQPRIEITEALVPAFCALWPNNREALGKNVVLSAVAILAQVNLAMCSHHKCLQAMWETEKQQLSEEKNLILQKKWTEVAPPAVY